MASCNKKDRINDIMHLAKLSNVKVVVFQGNPMNLGRRLREAVLGLGALDNRGRQLEHS